MDHVRRPVEFSDGLDDAAREEHGAVVVILIEILVAFGDGELPLREEVVVVDEIDLDSRLLNRCHLDDQRMVSVVDDHVHTR